MLHKAEQFRLAGINDVCGNPSAQAHGQLVDRTQLPILKSVLPEKVRLEFDDKLQVLRVKLSMFWLLKIQRKTDYFYDSIVAGAC